MTLRIDVIEVPEFRKDVAFYYVSADRVALLKRHLADDPTRGVNDPERRGVAVWRFGEFDVRYRYSEFPDRKATVTLLRMLPAAEEQGQLSRKARELLDVATRIKSLAFNWKIPGKEPDDD